MKSREISNIARELSSRIELIRSRFADESRFHEILGINYLLATANAINEANRPEMILSEEDYLHNYQSGEDDIDDGYYRGDATGFSRGFLFIRMRRLNHLLRDFSDFRHPLSYSEIIKKRKGELNDKIMNLKSNGRIEWLNRNGFYSFYEGILQGYIVFSEFGEYAEQSILSELKGNQSAVNKSES